MTKDNNGQQTSVWGKKWLGGYSGLKFTAAKIAKYIPDSKIYVEPFAGLGRTAIYGKHEQMILNDMSEFSNKFCSENFPNAIITHEDFRDCIKKSDSEDTFFLIDPPWRSNVYSENDLTYSNMSVRQYYENVLYLMSNLKGKFIVCTNRHSQGFKIFDGKYPMIEVEADGTPIFGKKTHTNLFTNLPITLQKESKD